nr:NAD(P)/FAD-dependent oxidoreductase [Micrococcus sp. TA1]
MPRTRRARVRTEVLVVGAGPTGLFLAGLLAARGVDVVVLERRPRPAEHSRAIGLHPPALHALEALGMAEAAVDAGVRVRSGVGYGDGIGHRSLLGELSLGRVDARFPFVLTLPQVNTERLLAARLEELAPGTVRRGREVIGLEQSGGGVTVVARAGATEEQWEARVVIGADGTRSRVRELAGVGSTARNWGDHYLMGDFDDPDAEPVAHIHLHRDGVVERFPLPGGRRRWVVHTGRERVPERAGDLAQRAFERIGLAPDPDTATMLSAFTVQRRLAARMVSGRTVLAGDAAHGISPIGGQGMTLGWLDALALAPLLQDLLQDPARDGPGHPGPRPADDHSAGDHPAGRLEDHPGFARFDARRRRAARIAARQAEANMLLGRPMSPAACRVRDAAVRAALAVGVRNRLARLYTMGWAGRS